MIKAGLVVEGGGMRGVYAAGVLDFFMEKDLYFTNNYGVSAGACHLCSYLSKQNKISRNYIKKWTRGSLRSRRAAAASCCILSSF